MCGAPTQNVKLRDEDAWKHKLLLHVAFASIPDPTVHLKCRVQRPGGEANLKPALSIAVIQESDSVPRTVTDFLPPLMK